MGRSNVVLRGLADTEELVIYLAATTGYELSLHRLNPDTSLSVEE